MPRWSYRNRLDPDLIRERSVPDAAGCWIWQGYVQSGGYGQMACKGRRLLAHRASWLAFRGPIPDGLYVCHRCDVPLCVNPGHLWLGTAAENVHDAIAKGRNVGFPLGAQRKARLTKLTDDQVRAIRARRGEKLAPLAAEFGCSIAHVSRIQHGSRKALIA